MRPTPPVFHFSFFIIHYPFSIFRSHFPFLLFILIFPGVAEATPFHAVRSAATCRTCHIEPIGWKNPEFKFRRCTLDCSGCHESATGGGLRKPAGSYYGHETLPMKGDRPSKKGDPEAYRSADDTTGPTEFRLWKGFSGWKEGTHPLEAIRDRFGDIAPVPRVGVGADFRMMGYFPLGKGAGPSAVFPMQADLYGMVKPTDHLKLYATVGLQGRSRRTVRDPKEASSSIEELLAMRELFVEAGELPYGGYMRFGRFHKPYGWRIPDHTSFIRREEGFDQNSQAFGVETGFNANYPYGNLALFYQGVDDWPGDDTTEGYGAAFTGGYRNLALHAGMSAQWLDLTDGGQEVSVGPLWALNAYPLIWLAQVDYRSRVDDPSAERTSAAMYALHELQFSLPFALQLQLKYDWLDNDIDLKDDHRHRYTAGVEWNPVTHTQLVLQYRRSYLAERPSAEDAILMLHLWL